MCCRALLRGLAVAGASTEAERRLCHTKLHKSALRQAHAFSKHCYPYLEAGSWGQQMVRTCIRLLYAEHGASARSWASGTPAAAPVSSLFFFLYTTA